MHSEFDLIARIRERAGNARDDVVLGIGDDAALLRVPEGRQLVVATDTLNAGVHFPDRTSPADIGWKALAVNLSDLAAMGAQPAWCTLSLSLPASDPAWIDGFLDGFLALAQQHRVTLVGGDTTRGPLSVCVTAHGFVDAGKALRRSGGRAGDDIWVTGTLGDAAGALAQWQAGAAIDTVLRERLDRPLARVDAGLPLAGVAHACIDISDGLLADLGHLSAASGVAAEVDVDALPISDALRAAFEQPRRRELQATGGDDYELCFTVAAALRDTINEIGRDVDVPMRRIGRIVDGAGVRAFTSDGSTWQAREPGYRHFV